MKSLELKNAMLAIARWLAPLKNGSDSLATSIIYQQYINIQITNLGGILARVSRRDG